MPTVEEKNGRILYQCDIYKMWYETEELAEACEYHCGTKGACSMEITRQAVKE